MLSLQMTPRGFFILYFFIVREGKRVGNNSSEKVYESGLRTIDEELDGGAICASHPIPITTQFYNDVTMAIA